MESYKCGNYTGAQICRGDFIEDPVMDDFDRFLFNAYRCNAKESLSIAPPGDLVSDYYRHKNLASSIILHPANECVIMYSMYDQDNCKGVPVTASKSFETLQDLIDYFPMYFKEGEESNGKLMPIRSVKHPVATSVEIFAKESF